MVLHKCGGKEMSETIANLYDLTENLDKSTQLINELSMLFYNGFSKLIKKDRDILDQLAKGFKDSPLREIVPQSIEKLSKSDYNKDNFTALVLAITSVQGAIHDALYVHAEEVFGTKTSFYTHEDTIMFEDFVDETKIFLENIQTWLIDLAIKGFSDLNKESIISFETVLETLESQNNLQRLGVILRCLTNEFLLVLSDTKNQEHAIQVRWMDLWCKAYLLTLKKQIPPKGIKISGKLKLVALQTYTHRNFLTVVLSGILEYNKENIYIEIEKSKFIIDLIPIEEFWYQLNNENSELFKGLNTSTVISVKEGYLFENGSLILKNFAATTEKFSLIQELEKTVEKQNLMLSKIQAIDRHPIQFKLPVLVEAKDINGRICKLGNKEIPIRFELQPTRRSSTSLIQNKMLLELHFDNGWFLKPLTSMGANNIFLGKIAEQPNTATPTYDTLKERSSKILREKK